MIIISRLFLLLFVASSFLHSYGLISRIKSYISHVKSSINARIKDTNWLDTLLAVDRAAVRLDTYRKRIKLDISAGYGAISSPDTDPSEFDEIYIEEQEEQSRSPVLWVHQAGRKAVRKAPDRALLGGFVLISSELLRRGVNSEKYSLPPSLRELANTTSTELDSKLELLSSLNWKVDPFLKGEYDNLQSQPLEVLDKFLASNVLPSVDRDLAPFLMKSMVDTGRVKMITQSVKDLVKLSINILENTATESMPSQLNESILVQTTSSLNRTAVAVIEQVDMVGQRAEEVVNDWNRNVVSFTGSIAQYLNTDSLMSVLTGQYPVKGGDSEGGNEGHKEGDEVYDASNEGMEPKR